jgi:Ca2+-binding RTX toxin-like protein
MKSRRSIVLVAGVSFAAIGVLAAVQVASAGNARSHPKCDGLGATIVGTSGDDRIVGTHGVDVIVARGGDDVIYGRGGVDAICGGRGKDRINGGTGNDGGQPRCQQVCGDVPPGPGLFGGKGRDLIRGGEGRDLLEGDGAPDVLAGRQGYDVCRGQMPKRDRRSHGDIAKPSCEAISGAIAGARARAGSPPKELRTGRQSQDGGLVWEEWTSGDGQQCVASSADGPGTYPKPLRVNPGGQRARFLLFRRQKPAEVTITAWHRLDSRGYETGRKEVIPYTLRPRHGAYGRVTA